MGIAGLTGKVGMQESFLNQMLGQAQQTTASAAGMRQDILGKYTSIEGQRIGASLGIGQQQAAQSGAGWAAASGAMGGIASGLGGGLMMGGLLGAFG